MKIINKIFIVIISGLVLISAFWYLGLLSIVFLNPINYTNISSTGILINSPSNTVIFKKAHFLYHKGLVIHLNSYFVDYSSKHNVEIFAIGKVFNDLFNRSPVYNKELHPFAVLSNKLIKLTLPGGKVIIFLIYPRALFAKLNDKQYNKYLRFQREYILYSLLHDNKNSLVLNEIFETPLVKAYLLYVFDFLRFKNYVVNQVNKYNNFFKSFDFSKSTNQQKQVIESFLERSALLCSYQGVCLAPRFINNIPNTQFTQEYCIKNIRNLKNVDPEFKQFLLNFVHTKYYHDINMCAFSFINYKNKSPSNSYWNISSTFLDSFVLPLDNVFQIDFNKNYASTLFPFNSQKDDKGMSFGFDSIFILY